MLRREEIDEIGVKSLERGDHTRFIDLEEARATDYLSGESGCQATRHSTISSSPGYRRWGGESMWS